MMTAAVSSAPRYHAEDFDTAPIRSAAPSYVSEAPSYHSTIQYLDSAPAYALRAPVARDIPAPAPAPRSVGLPPVPPMPPQRLVALPSFRIPPTWAANNAPAARHYRNVAERRITDGRYFTALASDVPPLLESSAAPAANPHDAGSAHVVRPLEDPYLVGEVAAAQARRQRLARESGDHILVREDRQWDWLLAHMKDQDDRQRNWPRLRREADSSQRKLLHRIGGRLLP